MTSISSRMSIAQLVAEDSTPASSSSRELKPIDLPIDHSRDAELEKLFHEIIFTQSSLYIYGTFPISNFYHLCRNSEASVELRKQKIQSLLLQLVSKGKIALHYKGCSSLEPPVVYASEDQNSEEVLPPLERITRSKVKRALTALEINYWVDTIIRQNQGTSLATLVEKLLPIGASEGKIQHLLDSMAKQGFIYSDRKGGTGAPLWFAVDEESDNELEVDPGLRV